MRITLRVLIGLFFALLPGLASANTRPVADAGGDRSAFTNQGIILQGSGTDPDGDEIVGWYWSLDSQPPGSYADLSPASSRTPGFGADTPGEYIVSLAVFDGTVWSLPDIITITVADNQPPVAVAKAQPVSGWVPLTVYFDGSGSYDDGEIVSYAWDFGDGFGYSSEVSPTYIYNFTGTHVAKLTVRDELGEAGVDTVSIKVYIQDTIFVDVTASGANNGLSWADAYNCLQDALRKAESMRPVIREIRVAEGTYKPDENSANPTGTDDRAATFQLINDVKIKGGYAGFGAPDPNDRDIDLYETILSGNIGLKGNADNSFHVVTGSRTDPNAILDGFIITGGNANGSGTDIAGGGMFNNPSGNPTITNCTFVGNSATYGGGMYNFENSSPTMTNCHFIGNSANDGGGIYNGYYCKPTLTNCTFSGNTAGGNGGGVYNHLGSNAALVNCTFSGNSAVKSGGIYNYISNPVVTNCILWGNSDGGGMDESAQIMGGTPVINYSCVQGWTGALGGVGNIADDPLFKDADGPDDIPGTEDDNLELAAGSPCIDAGDNTAIPPDTTDLDDDGDTSERIPLDLAANARFTDDPVIVDTGNPAPGYPEIVEMGAYERYEFCGSGAYPYPPGDVSGPDGVRDCFLDFYDFAVWAAHWMEYTGPQ